MGQFVTEPGSLGRVLLAVAVTVIAIIIGTANAIVGYYAFTGYRWTRIAGLISAASPAAPSSSTSSAGTPSPRR